MNKKYKFYLIIIFVIFFIISLVFTKRIDIKIDTVNINKNVCHRADDVE